MAARSFRRGLEFPNEGFVQEVLERHFKSCGFFLRNGSVVDIDCHHPESAERWIIEAKGKTTSIGLDFRTGLGQLVQRMRDDGSRYGIAVPDTPEFLSQCAQVSDHVRVLLGIHWLLISQDCSLRIVAPSDSLTVAIAGGVS